VNRTRHGLYQMRVRKLPDVWFRNKVPHYTLDEAQHSGSGVDDVHKAVKYALVTMLCLLTLLHSYPTSFIRRP
jgi:hypothetical protein